MSWGKFLRPKPDSGGFPYDANFIASNIKEGITLFNRVTGTLQPKQAATGTFSAGTSYLDVTSLTFTPSKVVLRYAGGGVYGNIIISNAVDLYCRNGGSTLYAAVEGNSPAAITVGSGYAYIKANGFYVDFANLVGSSPSGVWWAYKD